MPGKNFGSSKQGVGSEGGGKKTEGSRAKKEKGQKKSLPERATREKRTNFPEGKGTPTRGKDWGVMGEKN